MKNHVCQSCGMPLHTPEIHGTGADGLRIEDYCIHCFRDGGFTSDVTMDEMMRLCANYLEGNTRFYIANMRSLYPHLKRWAKKEDTQSEYYKSINRVLEYVKGHLHENTDLKTLAGIACISPYHFHRIFKSTIGESLAEYVNRLRMEHVAEQLKTSALSLAELAGNTGYSSEQALSRAFKNYFDLPPKTFKSTYFKEVFQEEIVPRICKVASRSVVVLREQAPGRENWQKLYLYALVNRLLSDTTESIELIGKDHYRPALTVKEPPIPNKHTEALTLPEGLYAIFTHKGEPVAATGLYAAARHYWLPKSKYRQSATPSYTVYLNNPAVVPISELLTEIYIPIEEK